MNQFIAILLCALFATALAAPNVDHEKVKSSIDHIKQVAKTCNEDPASRVDAEDVRKLHHEGGPVPPNMPAHTLCVAKNLGWLKSDGSMDKEVLRPKMTGLVGDRENAENIVNDCLTEQDTPEATAGHLMKCFRANLPPRPEHGAHGGH